MSVVFADSFYFIALSNPSDGHHAAAVRAAESLTSRLLTTHYVLIEVADALSAPRFRAMSPSSSVNSRGCTVAAVVGEELVEDLIGGHKGDLAEGSHHGHNASVPLVLEVGGGDPVDRVGEDAPHGDGDRFGMP